MKIFRINYYYKDIKLKFIICDNDQLDALRQFERKVRRLGFPLNSKVHLLISQEVNHG